MQPLEKIQTKIKKKIAFFISKFLIDCFSSKLKTKQHFFSIPEMSNSIFLSESTTIKKTQQTRPKTFSFEMSQSIATIQDFFSKQEKLIVSPWTKKKMWPFRNRRDDGLKWFIRRTNVQLEWSHRLNCGNKTTHKN